MDGCRNDHDELPLVDPAMKLPTFQLKDMPCLSLVLLSLEFIIQLIESTCPSLLLPNLDPILCNCFEGINEIHVILEAIIFEECPPLREITYHLQRVWREVNVELDI